MSDAKLPNSSSSKEIKEYGQEIKGMKESRSRKSAALSGEGPPKLSSLLRTSLAGSGEDDFVDSLFKESDRGAALLAAADLDVTLEEIINGGFEAELSKEDQTMIFGESGPLSSFAGKIRMAHALGYYGVVTRKDLMLIAKIRNTFAHSARTISFSNALISSNCENLQCLEKLSKLGIINFDPSKHKRDPRSLFITTSVFISTQLWRVAAQRAGSQRLNMQARLIIIKNELEGDAYNNLRQSLLGADEINLP